MDFSKLWIGLLMVGLAVMAARHAGMKCKKMFFSAVTAFLLLLVPGLLDRFFHQRLDFVGILLYSAVIVMSAYLGSGFKFYDRYWWWDRVVHFLSGGAFVSFGIAFSGSSESLGRFQILLFSFSFSIAFNTMWEILEYASDCVMRADNQRWQRVSTSVNHASETALQPAGLVDTMTDSIACVAGAFISCTIWWFIL